MRLGLIPEAVGVLPLSLFREKINTWSPVWGHEGPGCRCIWSGGRRLCEGSREKSGSRGLRADALSPVVEGDHIFTDAFSATLHVVGVRPDWPLGQSREQEEGSLPFYAVGRGCKGAEAGVFWAKCWGLLCV